MNLYRTLTISLLALALTACAGSGGNRAGSGASDGTLSASEEKIIQAFDHEIAQEWLEAAVLYERLARGSSQPERSAFLVKTGLMYYHAGLYDEIDPFFDNLDDNSILELDKIYRQAIQAGAYLGNGKIYQSLLNLPEIDKVINYQYKALALSIRSRGVLAIGKPLESAKLRMQIAQYIRTPRELEENHDAIWTALNRITEPAILRALGETQTSETRGWLELNLIARRSNMLPAKMEPWVDQWYQLYGEHTAAPSYAINLLEDSKRVFIKPKRIALMLPFSGRLSKVSRAIQNGFLYAYYQDPDQFAALDVIDASSDPAEFNLQYQQAIQNGADFVVGPISKDLIDVLQQRERLEVPTLTLNYGNYDQAAGQDLYQFGLRPEDEAEQIADLALAQGKHSAIVLVPDTEWGYRLQDAFTERFEALGGTVVGEAAFRDKSNDYSATIKDLLNLTSSNQRKSILQQVIQEQVNFDARRRQDIDMIFIAANSRQARSIKPQLEFHQAQNLTVYATSHISSSNGKPDDDRDLNDILYVDIPWMLDNGKNPDHEQIDRLWPDDSKRYSRLMALGIDAYRMIPSLRRLMNNPDESLAHNTGLLSVDQNGRIKRSLMMATYKKGRATMLSAPNIQQLAAGSKR